jgi:hypothetical protein
LLLLEITHTQPCLGYSYPAGRRCTPQLKQQVRFAAWLAGVLCRNEVCSSTNTTHQHDICVSTCR